MDDDALYSQTLDKIVRKLRGKYGFKRFLRDGYRTANEDHDRRYYKPAEMKVGSLSCKEQIQYHDCWLFFTIFFFISIVCEALFYVVNVNNNKNKY